MSTGALARINGEALAVPGLSFWGRSTGDKVAIICSDHRGAVEVWHFAGAADEQVREVRDQLGHPHGMLGGVEVHSPRPLYRDLEDPVECAILAGPCWGDGTSLGFDTHFAPLVAAGDSQAVLSELAAWHRHQFGGAS